MQLGQTALNCLGKGLHIAVCLGSMRSSEDIIWMITQEGRSFVISLTSLMRKIDIPPGTPYLNYILESCPDVLAGGVRLIAGTDKKWILEPIIDQEGLLIETIDFNRVLEKRQNFDPVRLYSRPDVLELRVNGERQCAGKNK